MKRSAWLSRLGGLFMIASMVLVSGATPLFSSPFQPDNTAAAQSDLEAPAEAADRLSQAMGGEVVVRWAEATSVARFVRATGTAAIPLSGSPASLEEKAYAFFAEYGALFGVAAPRAQLEVIEVYSDEYGSQVRLDQRFATLPVFNVRMLVHFDPAGNITAVNGNFVPAIKVPSEPVLSAAEASNQALGAVASLLDVDVSALQSSPPVLGVVQTGLAQDEAGDQALAYSTTVSGPAIRKFVYVDAINGGAVQMFEGIFDGLDRHTYDTHQSSDYDSATECRGEGDGPSGDPDCDNAHVYSGDTYNFFFNGFGRDSFDDQGTPLKSYVHYFSSICPNAFWNGEFMTYCETFPHDDVAGHEITHGVTEFSANLIYAYQPGALNESFSDIFGEAIDLLNEGENEPGSRWLIGEGIAPGAGLRDMDDPESLPWRDPASCGSGNYHCESSDNGGVHTNSGVPNKAFSLMVDGGTHNGISVEGIGLKKSVAVQYRALTRFLTPYSNFVDDYEALQAACRQLQSRPLSDPDPETGGARMQQRISKEDCAQVRKALDAVEMTTAVCTDTEPAAGGALCADGETVAQLFADDFETEKGWTAGLDTSLYQGQTWQKVSDATSSGKYAWHVNDELTSCSSGDYTADFYLVSPQVDLSSTSRPVLRFQHDFNTEGDYDGGTVEVKINGSWVMLEDKDFTLNGYNGETTGAPNSKVDPLYNTAYTGYRHPADFPAVTYYESRVDLSNYVSQDDDRQVQIRFRFGTDYCNGTDIGWYVDDVEIYECRLSEE